jgi:hypothetical protein
MTKHLKDFDILLDAMDGFIRANSNFESSLVINAAVEELEQSESLQKSFSIPLQHKLFNMDSALKWVLFMTTVPEKIIEQYTEDEDFSPIIEEFTSFTKFSALDALRVIASVYDIGVQESILSHIEDEDSDEDSDESDEESGDSEDGESHEIDINSSLINDERPRISRTKST